MAILFTYDFAQSTSRPRRVIRCARHDRHSDASRRGEAPGGQAVTSLLGGGETGPRTMFHFGDLAMIGLVLLLIVSSGAVWGALEMAEPPGYTGGNPVDIVGGLILKEIRWTGACTA